MMLFQYSIYIPPLLGLFLFLYQRCNFLSVYPPRFAGEIKISRSNADSHRRCSGPRRKHRQRISSLLIREECSRSPRREVRRRDCFMIKPGVILYLVTVINKLHYFLTLQESFDIKLSLHNKSCSLCTHSRLNRRMLPVSQTLFTSLIDSYWRMFY